MVKLISGDRKKMCNICGFDTLIYSVMDNAPLCENCVPIKKQKKIMKEADMIDRILKGEKVNG